jgi:hypothetical protein
MMLLAWGFAGVMGPVLGARVYVATGNYAYAFFGSGLLACGALGILAFVRAPQREAAPDTPVKRSVEMSLDAAR